MASAVVGVTAKPIDEHLKLNYAQHCESLVRAMHGCQRRLSFTDVQFICKEGTFFAHRMILACTSPLLRRLLAENADTITVIHIPDVPYDILKALLDVLYGVKELCLNLEQVVALRELGTLLNINVCNDKAIDSVILEAQRNTSPGRYEAVKEEDDEDDFSEAASVSSFSPERRSSVSKQEKKDVAFSNPSSKGKEPAARKRLNPVASNTSRAFVKAKRKKLMEPADNNNEAEGNNDNAADSIVDQTNNAGTVAAAACAATARKQSMGSHAVSCRECKKTFRATSQLFQHMLRENHLFPPCPDCGQIITTLETFLTHGEYHTPDTKFTCKYCLKLVPSHTRYVYHTLMCKSLMKGDYLCFLCKKTFRNNGSLKTHLLLHTGEKPFACNFCTATFRQRHHRSHHEKTVHGEKTEDVPPAEDSNNVHTADIDDRPYSCSIAECTAAFKQPNHRSYHERVIHSINRRTRHPPQAADASDDEQESGDELVMDIKQEDVPDND